METIHVNDAGYADEAKAPVIVMPERINEQQKQIDELRKLVKKNKMTIIL